MKNRIVSPDVEVFKGHLVCCGLSFSPESAISIPLVNLQGEEDKDFSIPLHDMMEVWRLLARVLSDESIEKVGQNFHADHIYWLEKAGFEVKGKIHDLMYLLHSIYPELPKSLAFSTSIYTEECYYKYEGKEYNPKKDRLDVLLTYNGKDCYNTLEAFQEARKDAESIVNPYTSRTVWNFYSDYMQPLYNIYKKMECKGIRIDTKKKKELSEKYRVIILEEEKEYLEKIKEFTGNIEQKEINYDSPKQVCELVYGVLKCPARWKRDRHGRHLSSDDETLTGLINNVVKNPLIKEILRMTLRLRKLGKAKGTYIDCNIDYDERIRCEWKVTGTETGRTSTGVIKSPLRTGKWGIALQTLTKHGEFGSDIRSMFLPDEGCCFLEFDLAQAESRIADVLAEDYEFLKARDTIDTHKVIAAVCYGASVDTSDILWMYKVDTSNIDKEQREVGKRASHAYDNGVGKHELSIQITKEMSHRNPGFSLSEWKAGKILESLGIARPNIIKKFHEGIQDALANNDMVLWTPLGRYRQFLNKWGRDLWKEAYAHIKQAIVRDTVLQAQLILDKIDVMELLVEAHDGLLYQVPIEYVNEASKLGKEAMEREIDFRNCTMRREFTLVIPCDVSVSYTNWGEMEKYNG